MARILLLTPQLPYPPQQGTSLRNWHILRWMASHHDVTLLTFAHSDTPIPEQLTSTCKQVVTVTTPQRSGTQRLLQLGQSSLPDIAERLRSEEMIAAVRQQLVSESYDIVQIEGLELAYLIPVVRAESKAAIVLDCHNAETELQRRAYLSDRSQPGRWPAAVYSRMQIQRLAAYEGWAIAAADAVVAVSVRDAQQLNRLASPGSRIFAIPNSIDVREYHTAPAETLPEQTFDLVFSGKMDYRPNIDAVLWFADRIWPEIRSAYPALTLGIVGQKPHEQLDRLRSIEGVTLTGKVDSVRPYLEASKVVILPLRIGSGTRLKLIEAMAAGKPIVSTTIGAEGFPVTNEKELLLADSPAEFAGAVARLMEDPALSSRIGQTARAFAQSFDWRTIAPLFEQVYQTAVARNGERASV